MTAYVREAALLLRMAKLKDVKLIHTDAFLFCHQITKVWEEKKRKSVQSWSLFALKAERICHTFGNIPGFLVLPGSDRDHGE